LIHFYKREKNVSVRIKGVVEKESNGRRNVLGTESG